MELGPDVVVLDVKLPDMSGFEVCRRIRETPRLARTAVLHVSAHLTTSESRVEGLEGGADAYLVQPVDPTELLATVRALLRLKAAEQETRQAAQAWATTFEALSEGVCTLDAEGRVQRCNRAFKQLLGESAPEGAKPVDPEVLERLLAGSLSRP
jgi:DNA-binding response OmpR family regulator